MSSDKSADTGTLLITIIGIVAAIISFLETGPIGLLIVAVLSFVLFALYWGYQYWKSARWMHKKRIIYRGLVEEEYLCWQQSVIELLYPDLELVTLFGKRYPAALLRAERTLAYPFRSLCHLTSARLPPLKLDRKQKRFLKLLGKSVRAPRMKGFALSRVYYNLDGRTHTFDAVTTNQEQNLVTCHILEWELYEYFKKKGSRVPKVGAEALEHLPYRARVHDHRTGAAAVTEPHHAYPLISVQAMVVFQDTRDPGVPVWRIVLAQRSEKVVVKPGFLQFVPAGGFEVYGHEGDDSEYLVTQGFNVGTALLREYAEELFNVEDFQENRSGHDPMSILSHGAVHLLLEAVKHDKAWIEFLGTAVDLTVMRHEWSFLILIADSFFCESAILGNWESKHVTAPSFEELPAALADGRLHGSSAGLLQLAMESERLKGLGLVAMIETNAGWTG